MNVRFVLVAVLVMLAPLGGAMAEDRPLVAVTDLTYEESVSSFFVYAESHAAVNSRGSGKRDSNGSVLASSTLVAGEITHIEQGEMHKFSSDIRGALLKSGVFRLIQGKAMETTRTSMVDACVPPKKCDTTRTQIVSAFDIIERIKKGYYKGADFVLFGAVSNVESRREDNVIQASDTTNHMLFMNVTAEFSLINCKTYEVVASFSAIGEGKDFRLSNTPGSFGELSRSKVILGVSKTLGEAVSQELLSQFALTSSNAKSPAGPIQPTKPADTVKVYN